MKPRFKWIILVLQRLKKVRLTNICFFFGTGKELSAACNLINMLTFRRRMHTDVIARGLVSEAVAVALAAAVPEAHAPICSIEVVLD